MKHLMPIDELFKSTYISAADKLSRMHPRRAQKLIDWAEEGGIDAEIDRDYAYPFIFTNYDQFKYRKKHFSGRFFITDYETAFKDLTSEPYAIWVFMKSNYDEKVKIRYNALHMEIQFGDNYEYKDDNFLFENRKDAFEFIKYVKEIAAQDHDVYEAMNRMIQFRDGRIEEADGYNINKLYTTRHEKDEDDKDKDNPYPGRYFTTRT